MKTVSESKVEMTEIVLPQHTNALGTMFGGTVMAWVDVAAAIAGLRHANRQVVTASVDALEFLAPIKLGWIVSIKASVNFASHKSCEVGVQVTAENPLTGERYHTASAYLTMVALDSLGKPTAIGAILPESNEEKRRFAEAQNRRQARLELKEKNRIQRESRPND